MKANSYKLHLSRSGPERWGVILAGGDGTRLRSLTRSISGDDRPKQFCPIFGARTLLDQTRERVGMSVSQSRTLLVVTQKHERFYRTIADSLPDGLLLAQPRNQGTAPAILYALLKIAAQAPKAIVALFPSDHYFADDAAFMSYVDAAYDAARVRPETIILLGITPDSAESEYGWIEPKRSILSGLPRSITAVEKFWEKPSPALAQQLMSRGCLWNSFVMVGRVDHLLRMTCQAVPQLFSSFARVVSTFGRDAEKNAVEDLYSRISETNFSHEVLATRPSDLSVMKVGEVGWSDLGDPSRVFSTLSRIGLQTDVVAAAS